MTSTLSLSARLQRQVDTNGAFDQHIHTGMCRLLESFSLWNGFMVSSGFANKMAYQLNFKLIRVERPMELSNVKSRKVPGDELTTLRAGTSEKLIVFKALNIWTAYPPQNVLAE